MSINIKQEEVIVKAEADESPNGSHTEEHYHGVKVEMYDGDSDGKTELNRSDDEDGVPPDFFDDFSNNDFLAGLDVVDMWEAGKGANPDASKRQRNDHRKEQGVSGSKSSQNGKAQKSLADQKKDTRRSRSRERRSRERRKRPREEADRRRRSNSREKDEPRRDPDKTKRDIQRDKVKCAKDKEAKTISEKLRLVETGLVPPGMEMDVDITELQKKDERERDRERRIKQAEESRRDNRSGKNTLAEESVRANRFTLSRSPSPRRRRNISPARVSPSYRRRRSRSLDRSYDRRAEYNRRKPSPARPRHADRSTTRHSRDSNSPSRKRHRSFLEELDHKLSLEAAQNRIRDIQQKINGGPSMGLPRPVPMPVVNPMAMGMPNQQFPPTPVYDQQFFIGNDVNFPTHNATNNVPMQQSSQGYNMYDNSHYRQQNTTQQYPPMDTSISFKEKEALFNDENITLSNYLAITERVRDNSKTYDLSNKVKVVSRCQDAMKIMTESAKPSGKLFYRGSFKSRDKEIPDSKGTSPLKKTIPVRYLFTTKNKQLDEKAAHPMNRLLYKLGIKETLVIPAAFEPLPPGRHDPTRANLLMKMTQTDPFKCAECEFRNSIKSVNIGVQCELVRQSDFGCQVNEDNFLNTARSALKNILKNQSFATLTPAQMLAQLDNKADSRELFPAARRMNEVSPERRQDILPSPPRRDSWSPDFNRGGATGARLMRPGIRPQMNPSQSQYNQSFQNPGSSFSNPSSTFNNPSSSFGNMGQNYNNPRPNFNNPDSRMQNYANPMQGFNPNDDFGPGGYGNPSRTSGRYF